MVAVQKVSWLMFSAFKEFDALLAEYAEECGMDGLPPPTLHEASYLQMERSGNAHILVATADGALLGFLVLLVNVNPHYSAKLAVAESFFVGKDARKSGAGIALRLAAREIASNQGAVAFIMSAPSGGKLAKVLARDRRCTRTNEVFMEALPCTT